MRKMTDKSLREAFAGESQAHMKYLIFAEQAESEGKPNIARLFRAIAFAEQVHATNHLKALGDVGETPENLQAAIEGETFEVEEMYPAYNAIAELQGEKAAQRSIRYAVEAEKIHAGLYSNAKELAQAGQDLDDQPVYVCSRCGYTGTGEAPDTCPVCGASKSEFKTF